MAEKELRSIQFPGLEDRYVVPEGGGGGSAGPAGKDGITPTIGANGNWYLGDTDTNKPSRGEKGDPGAKGADGAAGKDGYSPEATVTQINGGAKIIIKDKTGTTSANVMNGAQGPKGDAGPQGDVGPKGDSYTLTPADKSEIAEAVVAGGVQAELGDEPVSLGITGAAVGQIAKITAVDASGKPTEWEPVDMPSGGGGEAMNLSWKHIRDVELTPDIIEAIVSTTDAGDAFSYDEIMIEFIPNLEGYFYVRASQNALYSKNIQVWVTNSKYSQIHLGLLNKKIAITSTFRTDGSLGFSNGYGGNGDIDKISMLVFGASSAVGAAFTVKIWGR